MYKYYKGIAGVGNGNCIYYWQSKGLSDEKNNSITASNYSVTPFLDYYGTKTRVEYSGSCLKQDKATFNHGKIVNNTLSMRLVKALILAIFRHLKIVYLGQLI